MIKENPSFLFQICYVSSLYGTLIVGNFSFYQYYIKNDTDCNTIVNYSQPFQWRNACIKRDFNYKPVRFWKPNRFFENIDYNTNSIIELVVIVVILITFVLHKIIKNRIKQEQTRNRKIKY